MFGRSQELGLAANRMNLNAEMDIEQLLETLAGTGRFNGDQFTKQGT
jgi:hypothetical protein